MKRYVLFLSVFYLTNMCFGQDNGFKMSVYCNDGCIYQWSTSDIDSITYSKFGVDGTEAVSYVTQEIWTKDSVCRLSILDVDSTLFSRYTDEEAANAVFNSSVGRDKSDIRSALHQGFLYNEWDLISLKNILGYGTGFVEKKYQKTVIENPSVLGNVYISSNNNGSSVWMNIAGVYDGKYSVDYDKLSIKTEANMYTSIGVFNGDEEWFITQLTATTLELSSKNGSTVERFIANKEKFAPFKIERGNMVTIKLGAATNTYKVGDTYANCTVPSSWAQYAPVNYYYINYGNNVAQLMVSQMYRVTTGVKPYYSYLMLTYNVTLFFTSSMRGRCLTAMPNVSDASEGEKLYWGYFTYINGDLYITY